MVLSVTLPDLEKPGRLQNLGMNFQELSKLRLQLRRRRQGCVDIKTTNQAGLDSTAGDSRSDRLGFVYPQTYTLDNQTLQSKRISVTATQRNRGNHEVRFPFIQLSSLPGTCLLQDTKTGTNETSPQQDRNMPPVLPARVPLQGHNVRTQRRQTLPILSVQMPQELQNEATATQAEMDQDLARAPRQGNDRGPEPTALTIRQAAQRTREIRPQPGGGDDEGDGAD